MPEKVLIVDDEPNLRFALRLILEEEGLEVEEAGDGQQALIRLQAVHDIDLVITDLRMPVLSGFELLDRLKAEEITLPVIMITANGDERTAVEAMQRGALDYFPKPFEESEILRVVRRGLRTSQALSEARRLRFQCAIQQDVVMESDAMVQVIDRVRRVARSDVSVLITGESGVGKELVAKILLEASPRATRPYVTVSCATLNDGLAGSELFGHVRGAFTGSEGASKGLFREAQGGTLLLDEVGELSPRVQSALLRVLQERKVRPVGGAHPIDVDVRLLAATNVELKNSPSFRSDLYYRLRVIEIRIPALRERPEDIVPLARHFTRQAADRFELPGVQLSGGVEAVLRKRPWPGNVRELKHLVESLVLLTDSPVIELDALARAEQGSGQPAPAPPGTSGGLKEQLDALEKQLLGEAMESSGGNQSEAARQLEISRLTLSSKLKKHGLR